MALRNTILGDYLVDSPSPINLSYFWSFGSLLGLTLIVLVATGVSLAMHYTANTELAFISVENIMRSVNLGWLLRYAHANCASLFFIFVYFHVGRNLFYGSFRQPRALLWAVGVIIFIVMMATAFIGYVLPWGPYGVRQSSPIYYQPFPLLVTNLSSLFGVVLV
jgi:quinol-cytochrome oxidoreductase complex cytochrome b subunit